MRGARMERPAKLGPDALVYALKFCSRRLPSNTKSSAAVRRGVEQLPIADGEFTN